MMSLHIVISTLSTVCIKKGPESERCQCAGLWEFPGVTVSAEASETDRRKEMDDLLQQLLGTELSTGEVLQRQSLGSIVHIFSHIRMTLHVEKMAIKVQSSQSVSMSLQAGFSSTLAAQDGSLLSVNQAVRQSVRNTSAPGPCNCGQSPGMCAV